MANSYQYVRNDLEDTYGILRLQDKILEIMVYIDEFCRKYGITYYLMGGSALGAMRHGGFIPWDDDLDIFMDYQNYLKFMDCCDKYLDNERFHFQRENSTECPYFFSKLRMNNTTCISPVEKQDGNLHQGIFVDIMCLNNAARTFLGRKVQYYAAGLLKANACTKTNYKATTVKKKIQLLISKLIVFGPIKQFLLFLVRRYNKKTTDTMAHIFGRAKFENSFYPTDIFKEQRFIPFEQVRLAVPEKVEDYLVCRFGKRYMEMPDEGTKAMYQSHATLWDTEKDYSEYLKSMDKGVL